MRSLNKVLLIGNVGKEPELSYTPSGTAVVKFSLATTESWKDQDGEKQERVEWHNCVVWRKTAEIVAQYVKKGMKVYVEGKLQTRSWDDKDTGKKRWATEIIVSDFLMLSYPKEGQTGAAEEESAPVEEKEQLPF